MQKRDPDDKSQDAIEQNLKKVYQETLEEEIPDRFVSLLKRLRESPPTSHPSAGRTPTKTDEDPE